VPDVRTVLVTGAARGIGRAIAERFLKERWSVAAADLDANAGRRTVEALRRWGDVFFVRLDVSNESDARRGVRRAVARHGRLDVLVNNAGIIRAETGFDSRSWRKILDVNLTGAFFCAKHAAPHLKKTRGCIVNIASTRAVMSEPDTLAYAASKGGWSR
jgi:NAD(P)-dependent dehydrogenase (short-subunit alcohol dehydrogenase family)